MKISQLRTQHIPSPLGFLMDRPVFSWVVEESTGKKQAAARITVAADAGMTRILHDSGWGEHSSLGYAADMTLQPRTRCWWQVAVRADDGDEGVSEPAWFETGKRDEPWAARWIAMPGEEHPVFRRAFTLPQAPVSARLYICGLGMYEAQINGQSVTDEHFAPYYDSYQALIQVQTWDVTGLLRAGENDLTAMLGGGWYMSRFGFGEPGGCLYGSRMQLLAELRVTLPSGEEYLLATDEDWLCRPAPVTFSSIYDGESYDANLEDGGPWRAAEPVAPPEGALTDRISPTVRITGELKPTLLHTPAGELVLDFGQVLTGWAAFRCDLPQGRRVDLHYGELLQHDCFYRENLRSALAEFHYTSAGRPAWVRPHFTFYGFRYVKVEGMTEAEILAADFTAQVIHSDLGFTGELTTSHAGVNRLIENARWSQRGNFLDIPTDCPQRDERMGWTGDAQVFCATASYQMYTPAFFRKYLINMRAEQARLQGSVPFVVPDIYYGLRRKRGQSTEVDPDSWGVECGSCAWGDAATVIPWTVYQFYGDKALLSEMYPGMKAWADWIRAQDVKRCGGKYLWTCGFHFADWLSLDNPDKGSCFGGTENAYVASAYYYYSTCLTAKAAAALGYEEDAKLYAERAERIRSAFRQEYFTPTGRCAIPTQTALALALQFDLAPDSCRPRVVEMLKKRLDDRKIHLDTGFVGTPLLLPALTSHGLHDYAVTLLLNEDYPSWLYEVGMGATTIWERWNSVMPDGLVSDTGMNSMNHYSYGSVVEWIYRYLAGLTPCETAPGFRRVVIAPLPEKRFDHVECRYQSAGGWYESSWRREGDKVRYRIRIPFDCEAEVSLPGLDTMVLGCGEYEFTV